MKKFISVLLAFMLVLGSLYISQDHVLAANSEDKSTQTNNQAGDNPVDIIPAREENKNKDSFDFVLVINNTSNEKVSGNLVLSDNLKKLLENKEEDFKLDIDAGKFKVIKLKFKDEAKLDSTDKVFTVSFEIKGKPASEPLELPLDAENLKKLLQGQKEIQDLLKDLLDNSKLQIDKLEEIKLSTQNTPNPSPNEPMMDLGGGGPSYAPDPAPQVDYTPDVASLPSDDSSNSVKNKPKLIIDKYSFQPLNPLAGEEFKMTLSFFNTNKDKRVNNIKISLSSNELASTSGEGKASSGGTIFTPVGSSNTFYIDSIGAKGNVEKSITLTTRPTLATGNYQLVATFEYEDSDGNEFTASETIGIPIAQESKITTSQVQIPGNEAFLGAPIEGEIQFYNTGKDTLYNLMVKVEGDELQDKSVEEYIGNFRSGESNSYMFSLTPGKVGKQKAKIVFTYEDVLGKSHTVEKEFEFEVLEDTLPEFPMDEKFPDMEIEDPNKGSSKTWLWVGLGVLALALIGFAVYRNRKKKKEEEEVLTIDED